MKKIDTTLSKEGNLEVSESNGGTSTISPRRVPQISDAELQELETFINGTTDIMDSNTSFTDQANALFALWAKSERFLPLIQDLREAMVLREWYHRLRSHLNTAIMLADDIGVRPREQLMDHVVTRLKMAVDQCPALAPTPPPPNEDVDAEPKSDESSSDD